MQENSLSPRKLKRFIKHLCLATRVIEERDIAKQHLSEHLKKLKKHARGKSKQLNQTIKELEEKINYSIEKEKKASGVHNHEPYHHASLRDKMDKLDLKLTNFTESYVERKKRIQELEKKLMGKADQKHQIIQEIKDSIAILERKYQQLAKKHDKEYMKKIKEKIISLKSKLEKL